MKNKNKLNKQDRKKSKNGNKSNNKKSENKKSIKSSIIKFIIFAILILFISVMGFFAYKLYTFRELAKEMFNNNPSSVLDSNGNSIAEIGSERNRRNVEFDNIPSNLINAYISIEDERYYSHHGVDVKRTGAAIVSYIFRRNSSFGGSTLTQQLVKNLTGDNSNSIFRKIKEWFYAWTLNASFSKDKILEAYLNIIYTGPNIYGIQQASNYYFDKDIDQLSLAECAFLAGINHSPNSYNPFTDNDRNEKIKKRCKTVLKKMFELNYITEDEYNSAIVEVENGLNFKKGNLSNDASIYSYHADALVSEIISDLANRKHISQDFATNFFYMAGTHIYSTQKADIQKILENESTNNKYVLKSSNGTDTSQAAMVVIDHSNGYVVACTRWIRKQNFFKMF